MRPGFDPEVAFARLDVKVDTVLSELAAVKEQTTLTNGRVSKIEMARAAEFAVEQAAEKRTVERRVSWGWVPPAAVTVLVFVAGVAAERFI